MTQIQQEVQRFREDFEKIRGEVAKVIVGQRDTVEQVLLALLAGGNVLLEGVPGLGKTLLVRTLSECLDLTFSRIQFTPDLMPADITGTKIVVEEEGGRRFTFQKGPIFGNLVLADEINRATPKTQSALLEAMQEHSVTVGGERYVLEQPFFVLATQNPIEMEGTYPLPEAQLDRFLFKLEVTTSKREELVEVLERTTGREIPSVSKAADGKRVLEMQELARQVPVSGELVDYASRLVLATSPETPEACDVTKKFVRFGSSPRGAQGLIRSAKVRALVRGRGNVALEDIQSLALPALRHRVLLNFEGQAEGIRTEEILKRLLEEVPETSERVSEILSKT